MVSLVTGASGLVGSHVLDALLAEGCPVRALVRDPAVARARGQAGAEVWVGDVREPKVLAEAVRGVNVVYHCAAAVGPGFSPHEIRDIGLKGVRHLLQALRQAGAG